MNLNTPQGMQQACNWQRNMLALIKHGGEWFVPRVCSTYKVDHVNKTLTRTGLKGDPTINRLTLSVETSRTISRRRRSFLFARYRFEDVRLRNLGHPDLVRVAVEEVADELFIAEQRGVSAEPIDRNVHSSTLPISLAERGRMPGRCRDS